MLLLPHKQWIQINPYCRQNSQVVCRLKHISMYMKVGDHQSIGLYQQAWVLAQDRTWSGLVQGSTVLCALAKGSRQTLLNFQKPHIVPGMYFELPSLQTPIESEVKFNVSDSPITTIREMFLEQTLLLVYKCFYSQEVYLFQLIWITSCF